MLPFSAIIRGDFAVMVEFLIICVFISCLWSLVGLIAPRYVLWWADAARRTHGLALGFSACITLEFFLLAIPFMAYAPWWAFLPPLAGGYGIYAFVRLLRRPPLDDPEEIDIHCGLLAKKTPELCPYLFNCECPYIEGEECLYPKGGRFYPCPEGTTSRIPSFSHPEESYLVDTREVRCSCLDWAVARAEFDALDPRRLCKHLVKAMVEQNLSKRYYMSDDNAIFQAYSREQGFPLT